MKVTILCRLWVLAAWVALVFCTMPVPSRANATSMPHSCIGCDFSRRNLTDANLSGANYTGSSFSYAVLRGADFSDAQLAGVDFRGADLRGADFSGAQLAGVDFRGASVAGARFDGARLAGIDLRGIVEQLSNSEMHAILNPCAGCDLAGDDLHGRDLSGISIPGGDLRHSNVAGARLIGANLEGVDFRDADLRDAVLRNARVCWHNTMNDGADRPIRCIDLEGAQTQGMDFRGALICENGNESERCTPVDAQTLRASSSSPPTGAIFP